MRTVIILGLVLLVFIYSKNLSLVEQHRYKLPLETYNVLLEKLNKEDLKIAYAYRDDFYKEASLAACNFTFGIPVSNLRNFTTNYFPTCLSVHEIPLNTYQQKAYLAKAVESSTFYRYVEEMNLQNNIVLAQKLFLINNKIDFIFVTLDNSDYEQMDLPIVDIDCFEKENLKLLKLNWN